MFKKQYPWEAGLKMVSKFLGIDTEDLHTSTHPNKPNMGLFTLKSNNQISVFGKSQHHNFQLKQKWRKLMKFSSKYKYCQVVQLLREGSAIEDQIWVWMLRNSQKISAQLYSSKKQLFREIAYPKSSFDGKHQITGLTFQIQDFQQGIEIKMDRNQPTKQPKKRKFSITKSGVFMKNQPAMTERMSITSQTSTFSSQSHNSSDLNKLQFAKSCSVLDSLMCSQNPQIHSPLRSPMKSSYISSCSLPIEPFSLQQSNQNFNNSPIVQTLNFVESHLQQLPTKINHPILTDIIGSFLLHREDFSYVITLFNMAATFYYYTNSNQIKTFTLLNHVACSQFFLYYLSKDFNTSSQIIHQITQRIRNNCPSSVFLKNFKIEHFIQNWLYGFFYCICQNGSQTKEKIIGYLLINSFSIDSLSRLCQSLIFSLSRIINQGYEDRIYQCLQNPKVYIDKDVLFDHLLIYEE